MTRPQRIVFAQGRPAPPRDVSLNRAATLARSLGVPLTRLPPVGLGPANGAAEAHLGRPAWPADAVVVAEADAVPGPPRRNLDDQIRAFLRALPCPVWILAPEGPVRTRVVVAAVALPTPEPDALDRAVVTMGDALARAEGARLLVVHGWSLIGESIVSCPVRGLGTARARRVVMRLRQEREARLESLLLSASPTSHTRWILAKGAASRTVHETVSRTGAHALVMGYQGRTGPWGIFRGNLAEGFLNLPGVSLMAVRPSGGPVAETTRSETH